MIDVMNLGKEIYDVAKNIENKVNMLHQYAIRYVEAERNYRIELSREIMELRDRKIPVTIINDVARGNIAEQKFKRDLAEIEYKTSKDLLDALKSELSALQTLYRQQEEI